MGEGADDLESFVGEDFGVLEVLGVLFGFFGEGERQRMGIEERVGDDGGEGAQLS